MSIGVLPILNFPDFVGNQVAPRCRACLLRQVGWATAQGESGACPGAAPEAVVQPLLSFWTTNLKVLQAESLEKERREKRGGAARQGACGASQCGQHDRQASCSPSQQHENTSVPTAEEADAGVKKPSSRCPNS